MVRLTDSEYNRIRDWMLDEKTEMSAAESEMYYSLMNESHFFYMGEIPNQQGHCLLFGASGNMYGNFHVDSFRELTEEEV